MQPYAKPSDITTRTRVAATLAIYARSAFAARDDWSEFLHDAVSDPVTVAAEVCEMHMQHFPYHSPKFNVVFDAVSEWLKIETAMLGIESI